MSIRLRAGLLLESLMVLDPSVDPETYRVLVVDALGRPASQLQLRVASACAAHMMQRSRWAHCARLARDLLGDTARVQQGVSGELAGASASVRLDIIEGFMQHPSMWSRWRMAEEHHQQVQWLSCLLTTVPSPTSALLCFPVVFLILLATGCIHGISNPGVQPDYRMHAVQYDP